MKVISSRKSGRYSSNYFECRMSCGHTTTAYGRRPKEGGLKVAPKTCKCIICEKLGVK